MAFGLFPSYVQVEYQSQFGLHIMTLPTKQWSPSANPQGQFDTWNAGVVDADTMINDLLEIVSVILPATTQFTNYVIYNFPNEDADPQPVATNTLTILGEVMATGWTKAVQQTFTFRTEEFHIAKLVLLDADVDSNFDRVPASAFTTPYSDIVAELSDEDNGWSGRDNSRITTAIQASATLNEKLRRAYRMF